MKKIIFLLFCMIFLIGIVNAADTFGFDNYKRFDDKIGEYGKIEIWDKGDIIFDDRKLAEYEIILNKDSVINVEAYGIVTIADKSKIFDDFKFEKLGASKGNDLRNFQIYIWGEETIEKEVNEYEKVCEEIISNGTKGEICRNEKTGSHTEEKVIKKWIKYNYESLDTGTYNWKITGMKDFANQKIDWIPKAKGMWLDEWTWWDSNWDYRKPVNITGGASTLSDFPVLINVTFNGNMSKANMSDIRFVNTNCASGNQSDELSYEFDKVVDNSSALVWVKIPSLTAGTNEICMYYGNGDAGNGEDVTDVWSNQYKAVFHMKEGSGTALENSAGYGNGTLGAGTAEPSWVSNSSCFFGDCLHFDGGDNVTINNDDGEMNVAKVTMELWNVFNSGGYIFGKYYDNVTFSDPYTEYNFNLLNATEMGFEINYEGTWRASTQYVATSNGHLAGTYDGETTYLLWNATTVKVDTTPSGDIQDVDGTRPIIGNRPAGGHFTGIADEVRISNVSRNSAWINRTIDNRNIGLVTFGEQGDNIGITATQSFPGVSYNTTDTTPEVGCNYTSTGGETIEHYGVFIYNNSNSLSYWNYISGASATNINATFNSSSLNDGTYKWACIGNGTAEISISNNRTIIVDTTNPVINITYPKNKTYVTNNITENKISTTINWTITDDTLQACILWNGTENKTITCGTAGDYLNLTYSSHRFILWANDTVGNQDSLVRDTTWDYNLWEKVLVWTNSTTEGNLENFTSNVSYNPTYSSITANLIYNGTLYSTTKTGSGSNVIFDSSISIPSVTAQTNYTFYWQYLLSNASTNTYINSTLMSQQISNIAADNCSAYHTLILNFTLKDEETQLEINGTISNATIEVDLQVYPRTSNTAIINYSHIYNATNNAKVCTSINLTDTSNYRLYHTTRYEADPYEAEYNYLQNFTLNNLTIPQNINLFDLKSADSTEFLMTYKGDDFLAVEEAIIMLNRKYVSEGTSKTVEMSKTDSSGQATGHFDTTFSYTIQVFKDGQLLSTFDNIAVYCEDKVIEKCYLNLYESAESVPVVDLVDETNLYYGLSFNQTSRIVNLDFSTADLSVSTVSLNVTKFDSYSNTTLCSTSVTSSSGSIFCEVPASYGNVTLIAEVYKDGDYVTQELYRIITKPIDIFGANTVILILGLIITLPLMFIPSTIGVVIGLFIGLIISGAIFYTSGIIIGAYTFSLWILIAGFILIWKLQARGSD